VNDRKTAHQEGDCEHKTVVGREDSPEVFAVTKDVRGWHFNRRDFLAVAGGVAAAAALSNVTGCKPATPTPRPTDTPTSTPPPTPTSTPTPTRTPTPTNTPTCTPTPVPPEAEYVADVTIPDGTYVEPVQPFTKTWRVRNCGPVDWGSGTHLVFSSGRQMGGVSPTPVEDASPGDVVDVSVDMVAPAQLGSYAARWVLVGGGGTEMLILSVAIVTGHTQAPETGTNWTRIQFGTDEQATHFYIPCGSQIPDGAVCACDCVFVAPPCGTYSPLCSCYPVCTCVAETYWYPN
jgi:hypothetical protein